MIPALRQLAFLFNLSALSYANMLQQMVFFFCLIRFSIHAIDQVYLATPNISRDEIIGTNVGIRPFRKTGIRLEAEWVKDKLIIHNYGYGGSGLTLCFAGAKEVLNILEEEKNHSKNVAILGAGAAGLATAYELLEQGYNVTLYADEWIPNLTSNVAAGIWSPLSFPKDLSEEKKNLHQTMLEYSEARFRKSIGDNPEFKGIRIIPSYSFKIPGSPESLRTQDREEIIVHFDNGVVKHGRKIEELALQGQLFLEDLFSKVKLKGAKLQQSHFDDLEDILNLKETTIINCTSMGSILLFNDQQFIPVRGQLVYFKPQPAINYLLFQDVYNPLNDSKLFFVSVYPWDDRLILGGVYEFNKDDPTSDPAIIEQLIQNAEEALKTRL